MNEPTQRSAAAGAAMRTTRLEARPEPLEVALAQTALVAVDLQNGYASPAATGR